MFTFIITLFNEHDGIFLNTIKSYNFLGAKLTIEKSREKYSFILKMIEDSLIFHDLYTKNAICPYFRFCTPWL